MIHPIVSTSFGWVVVDFHPGKTHAGGRVAYGPFLSLTRRNEAADSWRRDRMVASVEISLTQPRDVIATHGVRA